MKKKIIIFILLIATKIVFAQKAPYYVVFDVTSKDTVVHQMVMRWVKEIKEVAPDAKIEIVFYAKSLDMVTKDKSVVSSEIKKYITDKNVKFSVCEVAMKNNNVDKSQLMDGVTTVPDGIYEIISRQHEGWGYIKAAR
jgi:intracellular sulfur oxidation DsrE/DsrF family protein